MMKPYIILFLVIFSANISSNDVIKSLRSILYEKGNMYVGLADKTNYSKMKSLWDSNNILLFRDDSEQDWKKVKLNSLPSNESSK